MKSFICTLTAILVLAACAQGNAMESGVVRWAELEAKKQGDIEKRAILNGNNGRDFDHLEVFAETLAGKARSVARHKNVEELLIVKEGELEISVGNNSKVMGPGSVAVIFPGERRAVKNTAKTPASFYVFQYRAKLPVDVARGKKAGGSFMVDWDDVEYIKSAIGGRRNIFHRPTAMFNNFEMHVSTLNEGLTNHAVHTHAAEEFVLMLKGDVVMRIGEADVAATKGDVVFLESMIPHALNNAGTGETAYFAFQFWE